MAIATTLAITRHPPPGRKRDCALIRIKLAAQYGRQRRLALRRSRLTALAQAIKILTLDGHFGSF